MLFCQDNTNITYNLCTLLKSFFFYVYFPESITRLPPLFSTSALAFKTLMKGFQNWQKSIFCDIMLAPKWLFLDYDTDTATIFYKSPKTIWMKLHKIMIQERKTNTMIIFFCINISGVSKGKFHSWSRLH